MLRILLAIAAVLLGGCATFDRMNPLPEHKQKIAVSVSSSLPSGMNDMPIGVYQIPDTRVYLSGHQRGHAAGMAFGLLGVAVVHSAGQSRGKELVGDAEGALKTDLTTATSAVLADKIKQHGVERAFLVAEGTVTKDAHSLSVLPYIVLTFVSDTRSRPFVILKASLRDAAGTEIWWSRYVSVVNEDRPLTGDDSWSKDNAKALREAVAGALDSAVDVLARDVNGKLSRTSAKDVKLKGRYVFMPNDIELPGKLVGSDERAVIFIPQIGDVVVFAGVNIFPKDLVQMSDTPPASK